jgi:hypothetical protein
MVLKPLELMEHSWFSKCQVLNENECGKVLSSKTKFDERWDDLLPLTDSLPWQPWQRSRNTEKFSSYQSPGIRRKFEPPTSQFFLSSPSFYQFEEPANAAEPSTDDALHLLINLFL